MHIDEFQLFLAPGHFENFADVTFIGNVGNAFTFNGDEFDPLATLAPGSRNVSIGTLQPGDTYTYTYQLTVRGRTAGAERGFQAFVGDPFAASFHVRRSRADVHARRRGAGAGHRRLAACRARRVDLRSPTPRALRLLRAVAAARRTSRAPGLPRGGGTPCGVRRA